MHDSRVKLVELLLTTLKEYYQYLELYTAFSELCSKHSLVVVIAQPHSQNITAGGGSELLSLPTSNCIFQLILAFFFLHFEDRITMVPFD